MMNRKLPSGIVKKFLLPTLLLLFAYSCQKQERAPITAGIQGMSDAQLVQTFSSDPDFKLIIKTNLETLDKMVSSGVDFSTFDFNDRAAFLKITGMSENEYLQKTIEVKNAAARFILKYNIQSLQNGRKCISCEADNSAKINSMRSMLTAYQNDKKQYESFVSHASYNTGLLNLPGTRTTAAVTSGPCCGNWFYICVAICAATIEALPLYLACCSYCFHAECCSLTTSPPIK